MQNHKKLVFGLLALLVVVGVALLANIGPVGAAQEGCPSGEEMVCKCVGWDGEECYDWDCFCKGKTKPEDKEPFFDCGKNPFKWNPIEGAFERRFIKWCDAWTPYGQSDWEGEYEGMTCDEVACAMGFTPAEFCDFSEEPAGPPPEMLTCPAPEE